MRLSKVPNILYSENMFYFAQKNLNPQKQSPISYANRKGNYCVCKGIPKVKNLD